MKKVLFFSLVFVGFLKAQAYVDCPAIMIKDSLIAGNVDSTLIYFNAQNSIDAKSAIMGPVDMDIKIMGKTTGSGTDTLLISVRGIKRKLLSGSTLWTNFYGDSTYVGAAVNDSTLHVYAIEPLYSHYFNFDGISIKFRQNGTDVDTVKYWVNARVWGQGGLR